MRYMLDIGTCTAAIRGQTDPEMKRKLFLRFDEHVSEICISALTFTELQYGVEGGDRENRQRNLLAVSELASKVSVLPFDAQASRSAARIRALLLQQGESILGPLDTLTAGQAFGLGLVVVTNNVTGFSRVPGLAVEDWTR